MKVLAVVSEPITAHHLRSALGTDQTDDAEMMIIAPALHTSALRFRMSDADEAIARAFEVQRLSRRRLEEDHVLVVESDTGESDPTEAVKDALVTFAADRVLLFVHPPDEERYREGIEPSALAEEIGVPVDRVEVEQSDPLADPER